MRFCRIVALGACLTALFFSRDQLADSDASAVVATVGSAQLKVGDVERRLRAMPDYQRRALGDGPSAIRTRVVREMLAPEIMFAAEARHRQLDRSPAIVARLDETLRRALEQQERARLQREAPVTDEDVQRYYAANRQRYAVPRRLLLWRILVDDESLARRVIADAQGAAGPKRWADHARQHSRDTATRMRRGDLGFVRSDGRTDVPRVRVDPALFAAADAVGDGEVVAQPVREGKRFAVVWRRGSLPATTRSLAEESAAIRKILMRDKLRDALDRLVAKLRQSHVRAVNESLLDHVSVPPPSFAAGPATSAKPTPVGSVTPKRGPQGLR